MSHVLEGGNGRAAVSGTITPEGATDSDSHYQKREDFLARVTLIWRCTCAIENADGAYGTGILVGPDLVLTNYHVIAKLIGKPEAVVSCQCRFDYIHDVPRGTALPGFTIALAEKWEVISSRAPENAPTSQMRLDYAIIRLARSVGNCDKAGQMPEPDEDVPTRGWLALPAAIPALKTGNSIKIWQHPVKDDAASAGTLRCCVMSEGSFTDYKNDGGGYFYHNALTASGSSGACCFNSDGDIVALHRAYDDTLRLNIAIPIARIVADIRECQKGDLIGIELPDAAKLDWQGDQPPLVAVAAQKEILRASRVKAASVLIDRNDEEFKFVSASGSKAVHVLIAGSDDNHKTFMERLQQLTLRCALDGSDFEQKRQLYLSGAQEQQTWDSTTIDWPKKGICGNQALEILENQLKFRVNARILKGNILVEAVISIPDVDLDRDKFLLAELAKYSRDAARAGKCQFIIVYFDKAAKGKERGYEKIRQKTDAFWTKEPPFEGLGACLNLASVGDNQIYSWIEDLTSAWGIKDNNLRKTAIDAWPKGEAETKLPMSQLEELLRPIIEKFAPIN